MAEYSPITTFPPMVAFGAMLEKSETIESALDLILISRHVERIADHAASIAEEVISMVSGRDIRHQRKESFTVS